jgi:hypothetical protein
MKIELNNEVLDALDMESAVEHLCVYQEYFTLKSGQEHYRLLRYLASEINSNVTEFGTHAGSSAIAMSLDTTYKILTYDIVEEKSKSYDYLDNIIFRLCDYQKDSEYEDLILNSKMIFIDAPHNGFFERDCYNWLKEKKYNGITIWDDIHLNHHMVSFWEDVDLRKTDITQYGHITGTGVIYFSDDIELVLT